MLLTPFLDFGECIERILGNSIKADEEVVEKPLREKVVVVSKSTQPRVVCVTSKLNIRGGTFLSGSGIAVGSGPLDQSKAYFEVHVEEDGTTVGIGAIGVTPNAVLSNGWTRLGGVPNSLVTAVHGPFSAGTCLGVLINIGTFPPTVSLYVNDTEELQSVTSAVRGDVWPAIEIGTGAARIVFSDLRYLTAQRESRGIQALMISRAII